MCGGADATSRPRKTISMLNMQLKSVMITTLVLLVLPGADTVEEFTANIVVIESYGDPLSFYDMKRTEPAVSFALLDVRQKYGSKIKFNYHYSKGSCNASRVGAAAAKAYHKLKVTVFIGPGKHWAHETATARDATTGQDVCFMHETRGCSAAMKGLIFMASAWNIPVITPGAQDDFFTDKNRFPVLTRINLGQATDFIHALILLMQHYRWKRIGIIYDQNDEYIQTLAKSCEASLRHLTLQPKLHRLNFERNDALTPLFDWMVSSERIIFFMTAQLNAIQEFLLTASKRGMVGGDYAFILFHRGTQHTFTNYWRKNDGNDELRRRAFQTCLQLDQVTVALPEGPLDTKIRNRALHYFNYTYDGPISADVANYYDSMMLYGLIANEFIRDGMDPTNGRAFAKSMWNRTFKGAVDDIIINTNGDRTGHVNIMGTTSEFAEDFSVIHEVEAGTKKIKSNDSNRKYWPGGKAPPDVPRCGYTGYSCPDDDTGNPVGIMFVTGVMPLMIITGVAAFLIYRYVKRHSTEQLFWWRIHDGQVTTECSNMADENRSWMGSITGMHMTEEFMKTKTLDVAAAFQIKAEYYQTVTAYYKNYSLETMNVVVEDKDAVNSGPFQVKNINHAHVARIRGAKLDMPRPFLVTDHGERGTLQDILAHIQIRLDYRFAMAFLEDIISVCSRLSIHFTFLHHFPAMKAMTYLHEADIVHERLSSMTCIVDARFAIKVTDYGLRSLFDQLRIDPDLLEYKKACLWRAPEVLRNPIEARDKSMDVYSFGIVIMEIITRQSPFAAELETMTIDQVLEEIKSGSYPPLRPRIDHHDVPAELRLILKLMTHCWDEDSQDRPDFHAVAKEYEKAVRKCQSSGGLIEQLLEVMEEYAANLEKIVWERNREVEVERKKTDELLHNILPPTVADKLKRGEIVKPEAFDCVTIYFSDVFQFAHLSALSTPMQVVTFLNDMYSCFDRRIDAFDVYKVETISDSYMVVSGLPIRNGNRHAEQIALMAISILKKIKEFKIQHLPQERVLLRIGINSGPVCAAVVGLKMPRYCLFGDTVNTASRMETSGEGLKIHISGSTCQLLKETNAFEIEERGKITVKGKGEMTTYWLLGKKEDATLEGEDRFDLNVPMRSAAPSEAFSEAFSTAEKFGLAPLPTLGTTPSVSILESSRRESLASENFESTEKGIE